MIRPALLTLLIGTAATGMAYADMTLETEPGPRIMGAIYGCNQVAMDHPLTLTDMLGKAGWERFDEYDGSTSFQTTNTTMMYADDGGFCMIESTDFNTEALTTLLATEGITPTGTDADGCTTFTINTTTATLTGGGNDPQCTSATEAALRFEPTP
jgi:hypothetical protein